MITAFLADTYTQQSNFAKADATTTDLEQGLAQFAFTEPAERALGLEIPAGGECQAGGACHADVA